jgi:hypothetical protein
MKSVILALVLVFLTQSGHAKTNQVSLSCHHSVRSKIANKKVMNLAVQKIESDNDSDDLNQVGLKIQDRRGVVTFLKNDVSVTQLKYDKVILARNEEYNARIVINDRGQADVTLQNDEGQYLVLRKVINCSKF